MLKKKFLFKRRRVPGEGRERVRTGRVKFDFYSERDRKWLAGIKQKIYMACVGF